MSVPIVTFAAYSNTGKTTYLEKLLPCLKRGVCAAGRSPGVGPHP